MKIIMIDLYYYYNHKNLIRSLNSELTLRTLNRPSLHTIFHRYSIFWVRIFFASLLLIGALTVRDYGISTDEQQQRFIGQTSLNFLAHQFNLSSILDGTPQLKNPSDVFLSQRDRDYGVVFELPAEALISILQITGPNIYFFRHGLTFLFFFISAIFFYKMVAERYQNRFWGILATTILLLSPRIYGDAFFNDKDLVFLSLFVISCYTLSRLTTQLSIRSIIIHALACALAIDARMMGILLPCFTFVVFGWIVLSQKNQLPKILGYAAFYLVITILFVVLFWPWLWQDPAGNFALALKNMARFRHMCQMVFLGEVITSSAVPWYYIPVWIGITTPIFYSVLFITGVAVIAWQSIRGGWSTLRQSGPFQDLLFVGLFFAPLLAVIVLHSVLYNGWRQMYFIYPAFVVVAVRGLVAIWHSCTKPTANKLLKPLVIVITTVCLSYTAYWMVRWHPYQYLYFNVLAGQSSKRFDVDYWGVAYREPLRAILNQEPKTHHSIHFHKDGDPSVWGYWQLDYLRNLDTFAEEDKRRVIIDRPEACSDYVFTTVMGNRQQYLVNKPEFSLFHELKVDGQIVYSTFKRNVVLYDYYQPSLNKVIDFNNRNTQCFLRKGWGQNEDWGVWSLGQYANLALFMPSGQPKTLNLDVRAFINSKHPTQTAYISINGVYQKKVILTKQESNQIELTIPPSSYGKEWIEIEFAMPQAVSPEELGMGNDGRKLGIGLSSAVFK